ncbi:MAG: hypothetical protein V5804_09470 [Mucilaginibacter sp.]|uniref:hypothetical protein n=1 Tax=Mucilaginibacter sp. TaxID=1882438 RepID=UPI0034E57D70
METIQRFGPWVTLIVGVSVVLFFCGFYVVKFYQVYREQRSSAKNSKVSSELTAQRQKIKADILSDLEKKLEAL